MSVVSGLMGPYMSPIPAVASAAMILSFFIAVMVTPWLMLKISGNAPIHGDHGAHGGFLGRIYTAVARPILKTRPRAGLFLIVVTVLAFGSLAALYAQHVTVNLLPYDNKDALAVVFDLPEGASLAATDALALAVAEVALGDVVRVVEETASPMIYRRNGRPAEMVMAELAGRFEAPLYGIIAVGDALEAADWGDMPAPEVRLNGQPTDEATPTVLWDGEWEATWVTFRDMGAAFGVALLGIYVLVVVLFGSFRLSLVVLTPVPLTFLGIMPGHGLWAAPFSATSTIGFIALAGIIVRNSILLVDFIRHADTTGKSRIDLLIEAGAIRFKPILLTALAAMFGAIIILSDPIFQCLALSLLFGLASSTLLTPAIYRVLKT